MSEAFFQEPRVVEIRGKQIGVAPLPVKHLSKAARLARPITAAIVEIGAGFEVGMAQADMVLRIAESADEVIGLCALATGESEQWIGELDLAELVRLATVVLEVNADFFIRRLMPAAQEAMESVTARVGQAASSASGESASA